MGKLVYERVGRNEEKLGPHRDVSKVVWTQDPPPLVIQGNENGTLEHSGKCLSLGLLLFVCLLNDQVVGVLSW